MRASGPQISGEQQLSQEPPIAIKPVATTEAQSPERTYNQDLNHIQTLSKQKHDPALVQQEEIVDTLPD